MATFGEILKKAEESGTSFEVLEAGNYVAKIIESEYKDSSGGKPQIKTRWEVTVGPKAGFKGLWNYFTLTADNANAMAIFYRQMTALGITNEFFQSLANVDPVTAMKHIAMSLEGKSAMIKVKVDQEWNNNKIERINPLPPEMAAQAATPAQSPFPTAAPAAPAAAAPLAAPVPAPQTAQPVMAPPTPVHAAPAAPSTPPVPATSEGNLPAPPF